MIRYENKTTGEVRDLTPEQEERFFDNRCPSEWHQSEAIAGDNGKAAAGDYGAAIAGDYGTAIAWASADAIIAALPDMIEPLVWEDCEADPLFGIVARASCPLFHEGKAVIYDEGVDEDDVLDVAGGQERYWTEAGKHPTIEAAKKGVEVFRRTAIMSAFGVTL